MRVPGSIAVSLCYVAAGRFDGLITTRPCRSVDVAAGAADRPRGGRGALAFAGRRARRTLRSTWTPATTCAGGPHGRGPGDAAAAPRGAVLPERRSTGTWPSGSPSRSPGDGPRWDGTEAELRAESRRAGAARRAATPGLRAQGAGCPTPSWSTETEWARVNLESFRDMSAPGGGEAGRADARGRARQAGPPASGSPRAAAGAEVGLAVGYLAQRVVGQYDVALIGPARAPRLLFVGPNLSAARPAPRAWTATSSCAGSPSTRRPTRSTSPRVPWLREHIGAIAEELFETGGDRGEARRDARQARAD